MFEILKLANKSLEKRFLHEMAENRNKVLDNISSQYDSLVEHFVKLVVFKNTTNDFNEWSKTVADILDLCNRFLVKTKTGKLKSDEYLGNLFGIEDNFDLWDAENILTKFQRGIGKNYPKFEITDELINEFFTKYSELVKYFVPILSSDKSKTRRGEEFKEKVKEIINN